MMKLVTAIGCFTALTAAQLGMPGGSGKSFAGEIRPTTIASAFQDEDRQEGEDNVVRLQDIPAKARAAIRRAAESNKIIQVKAEEAFGVKVFEASWDDDDTRNEIVVTANGTILELEEVVPLEDAPKGVRATAAKHFPEASQFVVEKKTIVFYTIEAATEEGEQEILVSATGQEVTIHSMGDDEEDEADEDEQREHRSGKMKNDDDDDDHASANDDDDDDDEADEGEGRKHRSGKASSDDDDGDHASANDDGDDDDEADEGEGRKHRSGKASSDDDDDDHASANDDDDDEDDDV